MPLEHALSNPSRTARSEVLLFELYYRDLTQKKIKVRFLPMNAVIEKENLVFQQMLPALLADHEREYAVVGDGKLLGTYTAYEDALQAGYEKFGPFRPFLVKQVLDTEPVHFISRDLCLT
ncbi:MAG: hypothetical protein LBK71_12305 [Verrucomicrobiales bacterium]|jgi:hypothetical protein|nr:hypothetical protein [Verrucomicrobiales bacterium]